jgi:CubicO group peptidase (beta-lactamase class C family)
MPSKEQDFSNKIVSLVNQKMIAGASWTIVKGTKSTPYYFGMKGSVPPFNQESLTASSVYDLASLTKVVGTTTRILQLIDERKIDWESKVNDLLVDFPNLAMSIAELLLHTSGLPADFEEKQDLSEEKMNSFFKNWISHEKVKHKTVYSDIGFILLGFVIETIDEMDLERSFNKHIFKPLKMNETSYAPKSKVDVIPTEVTPNRGVIQGEVHDSKAWLIDKPIGSAGLFSTLLDLTKFVQAIMNNKKADNRLLFHKETYQKLIHKNERMRTYGWELLLTNVEAPVLFHTGFTGTSIGIDVFRKESLILLTNRVHPDREDRGFIKARKQAYVEYFS